MSIIIHYSQFFIMLKEYFSKIVNSKILKGICLCPILFLELNYNIKKNFLNTNLKLFGYPIYKIIKILYYIFIALIFSFDMSTDNYFESHNPFNYFITISIYVLFIIMFVIAEYIIIRNYIDNNNDDKSQELIKIIFFLFEFFINDESNRLMILIIFIIYEFIFDIFYFLEVKKIIKIIISITIININEIFYLLVSRVFALENSKLIFSRTILYYSGGKFLTFLKVFYKIRTSTILSGFLLETNLFGNKVYNNKETYILKLVLNIKCSLNFIFYLYEFVFLKNNVDYITIMVYSGVDLSLFLLDFLTNLLIYLNYTIISLIQRIKYLRVPKLLEY